MSIHLALRWRAFVLAGLAWSLAAHAALPTTAISANLTSIKAGDKVELTVSGSDTDGNLRYLNLDQVSPNAGWYGAGVTVDDHIPPSGSAFDIGVNRYNYTRKITLTLGAAGTYVFKGAAHDSAGSGWQVGPASVTVVVAAQTAPSIVTQPQTGVALTGMDFNLMVGATGGGLTYQWRKGGTNIGGATNATLVLSAVTSGAAGSYDVIVSNSTGPSATSSAATVTVDDPNADSDSDGLPTLTENALGTTSSTTTSDSGNTQQQNIHRPTP